MGALCEAVPPLSSGREIPRCTAEGLRVGGSQSVILTDVRRSGKSTLQAQLLREDGVAIEVVPAWRWLIQRSG